MSIHQISVTYVVEEDRLLLRVRTHDRQLYEAWLTRRLTARLLQPLHKAVTRVSLAGAAPGATVLPEAADMLLSSAQARSREKADFKTPFDDDASKPFGEAPLLVVGVDLSQPKNASLSLTLRGASGKQLSLNLGDSLASNVLELIEKAVRQSDWGLLAPVANPPAAATAPARVLN